jgi:hypothetical protein
MNKLSAKLKAKKLAKSQVTQETLEQHREVVLSKGRKFKGQMTQLQRRIVLIAGGIAALGLIVVGVIGYLGLYVFQATDDVTFRVTEVLPVPVASVDGEWVPYGDYLLVFRSSIHPVERQGGKLEDNDENRALISYYKREALTMAMRYTLAKKLAGELGVKVERSEIEATIREYREVDGKEWSDESFTRAIYDNFGLSRREYERLVALSILLKKVMEAVDATAREQSEGIAKQVESEDFDKIAEEFDGVIVGASNGMVGEMDMDGGRAKMALSLEKGQVSQRFVSKNGDGYYFVKVTDKVDGKVSYVSLFVPFQEFNKRFDGLKDGDGTKTFITIPEE